MDNPFPELRDLRIPISVANLGMRRHLHNIASDGPITYREASSLLGVFAKPEDLPSILRTGKYPLHYDPHCVGSSASGELVTIFDSRQSDAVEVICEEVLTILRQCRDVIIFEVSEITRGAKYSNLEFSDELAMTSSGEYDRICALPPLWSTDPYQPLTDPGKAEQAFAGRVEMEIAFVTSEVEKKMKQGESKVPILCPLFPFRTFRKKCELNFHMKKYHSDKVDFATTGLVRRVTQELHNADVELSNLRGNIY